MPNTWYVTFETPKHGPLSRKRRNPRTTKTFESEAEAKKFVREQLEKGLSVVAGTINPQFPKQIIPSSKISDWLESD
jgi:hypothetical protein